MWAPLRIDSPAPSALPAGVLPVVAGVLRLPGSLPLLRLLCRGVVGFVISLFRLAGGEIWTDLQRGSSRVTQPEVAFGVRDLRPAHVGGSCRCRSIGEAFYVEPFRGPGLWLERAGWFFIRISWKLPCGPVMGAAGGVPERSFFAVGFVSVPAG